MTEKVTLERHDLLPMPLIYHPDAGALAAWQVGQLEWSYGQGQRDLAISCFDPAQMGWDPNQTAYTVLKAVMDFLYDHPEVERLTVRCAGEAAFRAYSLQWNFWFAAHKPEHGHNGNH